MSLFNLDSGLTLVGFGVGFEVDIVLLVLLKESEHRLIHTFRDEVLTGVVLQ